MYLVFGAVVLASMFLDKDKIALIATALADRRSVSFTDLLLQCRARSEMIVTFMALLELMKNRVVKAVQVEQFGAIRLRKALSASFAALRTTPTVTMA